MARITKAVVNEWWANTSFYLMEKITGYRQDDFSSENGCGDFVDVCDDWWDKLSLNEKKMVYRNWN